MAEAAPGISIAPVETAADIAAVQDLFREYAEFMGFELCFQGFEKELEDLPGAYAPPTGRLLLCRAAGEPAGCVAFCRYAPGVAELKRLFVRPAFRQLKIGRNLAGTVMHMAGEAGYAAVWLETVPGRMAAAVNMYEQFGFVRAACPEGTDPQIVCYSRNLSDMTG